MRKHKNARTPNHRLESLRGGATVYLEKAPDFIDNRKYRLTPKFDTKDTFLEFAAMLFSSLSSRRRGPNPGRAETATASASPRASPPGSPTMVVSCYKLKHLMCLILLLSFQLAISAETTAAPLSCKIFQSNQFLEFPLFPWMPLQTHETSTDAQGGEAPDAPIPASPPRDPYDGLDLQRKSGVDQGGVAPRSPAQVSC